METYTKIVNEKEFMFTLIASNEDISPKLISWTRNNSNFTIQIEKYPITLKDAIDRSIYKDEIIRLIQKLHSLGIFHADIHLDNIVVDPILGKVKLIDFGISCWIDNIPEIVFFKGYRETALSINHLLDLEVNEVLWLCYLETIKLNPFCLRHKMVLHPIFPVLYCEYNCEHIQKLYL
jgi:serine/threonine protein kinase